jgi:hypothetical protein
MRVQFALIEKGQPVAEDTLTLTSASQRQVYHAKTGDTSRNFIVTYAFGRPSASFEIKGPAYETALAIGVHQSTESEQIAIGNWATLVFECTPLP